ncbi:MAG: hypothetical protein U0R49_11600 [Fimbriimonadales bacterium]
MSELTPIGELIPKRRRHFAKVDAIDESERTLTPEEQLVLDLVKVGVSLRKAEQLVKQNPHEKIRKQLDWLPSRNARKPASLLIVAIERDYDAPAYL